MKITTYGHSMIIMIIGIMFLTIDTILASLIGGLLLGTSVRLARKSGIEDCEKNK